MISIALCTYNGENFIAEQLKSIANQTLPPGEIIVCDDGSSDNTVEIIQQFAKGTSIPIHIYVSDTTLGVTLNFKKAIGLCNGEFIALCDQDDVWLSENLEKKIAEFEKKGNEKVDAVFSDLQLVDQCLQPLRHTMWETLGFSEKLQRKWRKGKALEIITNSGNIVTGASLVFRASLRKKFMQYPGQEFHYCIHDAIIAITAAKQNSIRFIPESTILYRQHQSQQIGGGHPTRSLKERLRTLMNGTTDLDLQLEKAINIKEKYMLDLQRLEVSNSHIDFLKESVVHLSKRRKLLRRPRLLRVAGIVREFVLSRYNKYSNSAILDPLRDFFYKG